MHVPHIVRLSQIATSLLGIVTTITSMGVLHTLSPMYSQLHDQEFISVSVRPLITSVKTECLLYARLVHRSARHPGQYTPPHRVHTLSCDLVRSSVACCRCNNVADYLLISLLCVSLLHAELLLVLAFFCAQPRDVVIAHVWTGVLLVIGVLHILGCLFIVLFARRIRRAFV